MYDHDLQVTPSERMICAARDRLTAALRALAVAASILAGASPATAQSVEAEIRAITDASTHPYAVPASRTDWIDLRRIYAFSASTPLWLEDRRPSAAARRLVEALLAARTDGLRPDDYAAARLAEEATDLTAGRATARAAARFDTAMALSLLHFVSDRYHGRIAPSAVGFDGLEPRPRLDRPTFLRALARAEDPAARLRSLDPGFPVYGRLRDALPRMIALARRGSLDPPEHMTILRPGDAHPEVPRLRRFLLTLGDLDPAEAGWLDSEAYDPPLIEAVERFQSRHGLQVDGVVGPNTLRQMRVPPSRRVEQIELAMERMRWVREPQGERFIIVNIPAFHLLAFDQDRSRPHLTMEVVVGRAARLHRTPVLQADMTTVVFRPYWNVPQSIARREILPEIERDPGYLERKRMELVDGRVRQRPGAHNALGLVKFRIPNRYDIYLHDTPRRSLFARARRDFSHGCIRLARPAALAEYVLGSDPDWTRERIEEAMRRGRNDTHVAVEPPIPVYILYSTAIVDSPGRLHFFRDVYGHDAELRRVLGPGRFQISAFKFQGLRAAAFIPTRDLTRNLKLET